jgi:transporter family protein
MTDSWQFWALLSAGFAALTAVLSKLGVRDVDPDAALLIRTAVVIVLLSAAIPLTRSKPLLDGFTSRTSLYLVLAGLATAASWACYFRALKVGDVARVAAVDKLSVVLAAVIAAAAIGERIGAVGWVGVLLVGAGAALLSLGR